MKDIVIRQQTMQYLLYYQTSCTECINYAIFSLSTTATCKSPDTEIQARQTVHATIFLEVSSSSTEDKQIIK